MERTILHVDANCFYASVECLYNPEIRNKPVAVVGNIEKRHGIVLTANYIAKREFGVKTGDIVWEAQKKCPELVVIEANMPLYMKYSKMLSDILLRYSDMVESFGCDEAWVDVTNSRKIFGSGIEIAKKISNNVKSELGITVSIGVSFNKVFAKLGSDMKKPDGITEITKENFKEKVWKLPVSDLLYVGKKTKIKLIQRNINTIGDLARTNPEYLNSYLGKAGIMLHDFANGNDFSPVKNFSDNPEVKSVGNSTTLYRDLTTDEEVKAVMFALAQSVTKRMRKKGVFGKCVSIWIRNNKFSSFVKQSTLAEPTDLDGEIARSAFSLFEENYKWYYPIRAVGITVSDLSRQKKYEQADLYKSEEKYEKLEKLARIQDDLKIRFGDQCIKRCLLLKDTKLTDFTPHSISLSKNSDAAV